MRKDGEWDEYPSISQKALKSIRKGEKIRYLKDQKNEINNYNLAYELQINKKIYIPIKQMMEKKLLQSAWEAKYQMKERFPCSYMIRMEDKLQPFKIQRLQMRHLKQV